MNTMNTSGLVILQSNLEFDRYQDNRPYRFINELPGMQIFNRHSKVALLCVDMDASFFDDPKFSETTALYICVDVVDESIFGGSRIRCLQRFGLSKLVPPNRRLYREFDKPLYLPLSKFQFSKIEVRILNETLVQLPLPIALPGKDDYPCTIVLKFK